MDELNSHSFPDLKTRVHGTWAPLLLYPAIDSPERLVIGVVAAADGALHLEPANHLERLTCLYDKRARELLFAARVSLRSISEQAESSVGAIKMLRPPASGVEIGEEHDAVGLSAKHIAKFWMNSISSLYQYRDIYQKGEHLVPVIASTQQVATLARSTTPAAFLPSEIMGHVIARNPLLISNFNSDIAPGKRRRSPAQGVHIDYKSHNLTANFDVLPINSRTPAINRIVKRMWDLEIDRDRSKATRPDRYEMLVEYPALELRNVGSSVSRRIDDILQDLESQADERHIRLRPLPNVAAIGERILEAEAH